MIYASCRGPGLVYAALRAMAVASITVLLLHSPCSFAFADARPTVAIAPIELAPVLQSHIVPHTLTDILLEYGKGGLFFEAVLPDEYLNAVINRMRTEITLTGSAQALRPNLTGAHTHAAKMLLPTLSQIGTEWTLTAILLDMRTLDFRSLTITAKGDESAIGEVLKELWRSFDAPSLLRRLNQQPGVRLIALASDGTMLAAAGPEPFIRLWDTATGNLLCRCKTRPEGFLLIRFRTDFLECVTHTGCIESWKTNRFRGGEAQPLQPSESIQAPGIRPFVIGCAASDGTNVMTLAAPPLVHFIDALSGTQVRDALNRHVTGMAVSADGRTLAYNWCPPGRPQPGGPTPIGPSFDTLEYFDVNASNTSPLYLHRPDTDATTCLQFFGNELRLYTGHRDGTIRCWNLQSRTEDRVLRGHEDAIASLASCPNLGLVGSIGRDGTARLWDNQSGRMAAVMKAQGGRPTLGNAGARGAMKMCFSSNGAIFAVSGFWGPDVQVWSMKPGT
jgi:WD40 repeat protein